MLLIGIDAAIWTIIWKSIIDDSDLNILEDK